MQFENEVKLSANSHSALDASLTSEQQELSKSIEKLSIVSHNIEKNIEILEKAVEDSGGFLGWLTGETKSYERQLAPYQKLSSQISKLKTELSESLEASHLKTLSARELNGANGNLVKEAALSSLKELDHKKVISELWDTTQNIHSENSERLDALAVKLDRIVIATRVTRDVSIMTVATLATGGAAGAASAAGLTGARVVAGSMLRGGAVGSAAGGGTAVAETVSASSVEDMDWDQLSSFLGTRVTQNIKTSFLASAGASTGILAASKAAPLLGSLTQKLSGRALLGSIGGGAGSITMSGLGTVDAIIAVNKAFNQSVEGQDLSPKEFKARKKEFFEAHGITAEEVLQNAGKEILGGFLGGAIGGYGGAVREQLTSAVQRAAVKTVEAGAAGAVGLGIAASDGEVTFEELAEEIGNVLVADMLGDSASSNASRLVRNRSEINQTPLPPENAAPENTAPLGNFLLNAATKQEGTTHSSAQPFIRSATNSPEPSESPEEQGKRLIEELKQGKIPEKIMEDYSLVPFDSEPSRKFDEGMQLLAREIYGKFHDFDKQPVRFILVDEEQPNAFFMKYANPPIFGFTKGLFKGGQLSDKLMKAHKRGDFPGIKEPQSNEPYVNSKEELVAIMLHEFTHFEAEKEFGVHKNSKAEEMAADLRPLTIMHDLGMNPNAMSYVTTKLASYKATEVIKNKENKKKKSKEEVEAPSWGEYFDPHPTELSRRRAISTVLASLTTKRGDLSKGTTSDGDLGPLVSHALEAKHDSFIDGKLGDAEVYHKLSQEEKITRLGELVNKDLEFSERRTLALQKRVEELSPPETEKERKAFENFRQRIYEYLSSDGDPRIGTTLYRSLGKVEDPARPLKFRGTLAELDLKVRSFIEMASSSETSSEDLKALSNEILSITKSEKLFGSKAGRQFVSLLPFGRFEVDYDPNAIVDIEDARSLDDYDSDLSEVNFNESWEEEGFNSDSDWDSGYGAEDYDYDLDSDRGSNSSTEKDVKGELSQVPWTRLYKIPASDKEVFQVATMLGLAEDSNLATRFIQNLDDAESFIGDNLSLSRVESSLPVSKLRLDSNGKIQEGLVAQETDKDGNRGTYRERTIRELEEMGNLMDLSLRNHLFDLISSEFGKKDPEIDAQIEKIVKTIDPFTQSDFLLPILEENIPLYGELYGRELLNDQEKMAAEVGPEGQTSRVELDQVDHEGDYRRLVFRIGEIFKSKNLAQIDEIKKHLFGLGLDDANPVAIQFYDTFGGAAKFFPTGLSIILNENQWFSPEEHLSIVDSAIAGSSTSFLTVDTIFSPEGNQTRFIEILDRLTEIESYPHKYDSLDLRQRVDKLRELDLRGIQTLEKIRLARDIKEELYSRTWNRIDEENPDLDSRDETTRMVEEFIENSWLLSTLSDLFEDGGNDPILKGRYQTLLEKSSEAFVKHAPLEDSINFVSDYSSKNFIARSQEGAFQEVIMSRLGDLVVGEELYRLAETFLSTDRVQVSAHREKLRDIMSNHLAEMVGTDHGDSEAQDALIEEIQGLKETLPKRELVVIVEKALKLSTAQKELADEANSAVRDISAAEAETIAQRSGAVEPVLWALNTYPEEKEALVDFLSSPLTDESVTAFAKNAESLSQSFRDEDFRFTSFDDLNPNATEQELAAEFEERKHHGRTIYDNFWAQPIEVRAVAIRELLVDPKSGDFSVPELMEQVMPRAFNRSDPDYQLIKRGLNAYVESIDHNQRDLFLSALLAGAKQNEGDGSMGLGDALALIIENLGPAEVKVGQAGSSHPQIRKDIAFALSRLNHAAAEPSRLEVTSWADIARPGIREAYAKHIGLEAGQENPDFRVGKVLGSASLFVAVELEMSNGESIVVALRRPYAQERAEKGFKDLTRAVSHPDNGLDPSQKAIVGELLSHARSRIDLEVDPLIADKQAELFKQMYQGTKVRFLDSKEGEEVEVEMGSVEILGSGIEELETTDSLGWYLMNKLEGDHFLDLKTDTEAEKKEKRQKSMAILATELNNIARGIFDVDRHSGQIKINDKVEHLDVKATSLQKWDNQDFKQFAEILFSMIGDKDASSSPAEALLLKQQELEKDGEEIRPLVREVQRALPHLAGYTEFMEKEDVQRVFISAFTQHVHPELVANLAAKVPPYARPILKNWFKTGKPPTAAITYIEKLFPDLGEALRDPDYIIEIERASELERLRLPPRS